MVRPVDDITEEELQLVADNMTEKVYNRSTVGPFSAIMKMANLIDLCTCRFLARGRRAKIWLEFGVGSWNAVCWSVLAP